MFAKIPQQFTCILYITQTVLTKKITPKIIIKTITQ